VPRTADAGKEALMSPGAALALALVAAGPGEGGGLPDPRYGFTTDRDAVRRQAADDLVRQLADPEKGREAAERLVRFGRAAVGPVSEALLSSNPQVRFYAANILDIIGSQEGAKALLARLADEDENLLIRRIAARGVGRAEYAPAAPVLARIAREAPPKPEDEGGSRPVDDENFRFELVRALAYIGTSHADEILLEALTDDSARIRKAAATGLGDHRILAGLSPLRKLLRDPDGSLAAAAARALAKFGGRASHAVPDLVEGLERDDLRVRRACKSALVLATGQSFKTAEEWREWWRRKTEPPAGQPSSAAPKRDFPLPATMPGEIRRPEPGGEASEEAAVSEDAPPALGMPWEE
jgi:HEAT repeat protein